jgi:hypothetical protein
LNQEAIRYFRLGRHALRAGLELLSMRTGDQILIPAFICRDLLAPIRAIGAEPIFYHVDEKLRPQALPRAPRVRAVLAVNYFGFAQDLAPFQEYCTRNEAVLIEDNAHGFLSHDESGNVLGARGDLGILSMRKTFTLPDGGALMANRPDLQSRLPAPLACRDEPLSVEFRIKRQLACLQRDTGLRVKSIGQDLARAIRWLRTGWAIAPSEPESEYDMPSVPAPHCNTLASLRGIDVAAESLRRRRLYGAVRDRLAGTGAQPIFSELVPGTVPYGYPFHANHEISMRAGRIARRLGLDCINWPDLPAAVTSNALPHYRSVWLVNFLC